MIGNPRNNRIGNLCRVLINRWVSGVLVPEERFFRSLGQAADFARATLTDRNVSSVKVYNLQNKLFMSDSNNGHYGRTSGDDELYA